jgi:hypothetical protein
VWVQADNFPGAWIRWGDRMTTTQRWLGLGLAILLGGCGASGAPHDNSAAGVTGALLQGGSMGSFSPSEMGVTSSAAFDVPACAVVTTGKVTGDAPLEARVATVHGRAILTIANSILPSLKRS